VRTCCQPVFMLRLLEQDKIVTGALQCRSVFKEQRIFTRHHPVELRGSVVSGFKGTGRRCIRIANKHSNLGTFLNVNVKDELRYHHGRLIPLTILLQLRPHVIHGFYTLLSLLVVFCRDASRKLSLFVAHSLESSVLSLIIGLARQIGPACPEALRAPFETTSGALPRVSESTRRRVRYARTHSR
jgi:hypothetical protein